MEKSRVERKGHDDLVLALQRTREKRGGIMSYLEEKYGNVEDDTVIDFDQPLKSKGKKPAKRTSKAATKSPSKRQKKA